MNEDELRAFLESATDDEKKDDAKDPASPRMSFNELMGIDGDSPADVPDDSQGTEGSNRVSGDRDATPGASEPTDATPKPAPRSAPVTGPVSAPISAPVSAASQSKQDEPELVPIVLPGPPQATKPSTAPFWEQDKPEPVKAQAPERKESPGEVAGNEPPPATAPLPINTSSTDASPADPSADPSTNPSTTPFPELFASDPLPPAETGEYEKISVVGSERTHSRYMPWIIVGAGAVLAIVASLVVVFAVRGGEEAPPAAEPTTQAPAEPTTSEPTEEPTTEPTETEPAADEPPKVEVGDTGGFEIASWGMKGEISAKFGWPSYKIEGDNLTFEGGTLLPQFPESCAAMRTGFGITKKADGSFEVYRPAETCEESPDFYNEVWGLMAAIIPTLKAA